MKAPKPKRLVGPRRGVHANVSDRTYARLQRHAPAANLSASKYAGVAIEFYIDLEEKFGGPLTEQFRGFILERASGVADKVKEALK